MERKGISQVLFLIIAASVLMMVALTLIFMFQSGAGSTNQQAQAQTCISSVEAKCQSLGDQYVRFPTACTTREAGDPTLVSGVPYAAYVDSGTAWNTVGLPANGEDYSTGDFHVDCDSVL